ncbi:hypothetical protein FIV07_22530 [Mycobacterium sp. THAF192]|nr:hypothetical protein FIV07_22530 [Mycobacterium sp. THAF192]
MSLPDDHSARYGWRFWMLLPAHARLLAPYGSPPGVMIGSHVVDAQCPHGNSPPSTKCRCGIHYLPSLAALDSYFGDFIAQFRFDHPYSVDDEIFFRRGGVSACYLSGLIHDDQAARGPGELSIAITFGWASGEIATDYEEEFMPGVLRGSRYHMLSMMVPTSDVALRQRLKEHYRVPILAGIGRPLLTAVEEAIRSEDVRPDPELISRPPIADDDLTRRWNIRLRSAPAGPAPIHKSDLPEHAKEMMLALGRDLREQLPPLPAELLQ